MVVRPWLCETGPWTLQETHRNSTSYARDEARTSERLLDRHTP